MSKPTVTGLSREIELGMENALKTYEGRAFLGYLLGQTYFMQELTDSSLMATNAIALRLFNTLKELNPGDAVKLFQENFVGGEA